jgi:hypothetical protein
MGSSASSIANQTLLNDTVVSSHRNHHNNHHHADEFQQANQQQQQQQHRPLSGRVEKHSNSMLSGAAGSNSSSSLTSNKLKLVNSQNGQLVNKSGKLSINSLMKNSNGVASHQHNGAGNKIRSNSIGTAAAAQLNDSMGSTVNSNSSAHSSLSTSMDDISNNANNGLPTVNVTYKVSNLVNQQVISQSSSKINEPSPSLSDDGRESENGTGFVVYHQKVRHNSAIDSLLTKTADQAAVYTNTEEEQQQRVSPSKSVENLKMMS